MIDSVFKLKFSLPNLLLIIIYISLILVPGGLTTTIMKIFNFAFFLASLAHLAFSIPLHPGDEVSTTHSLEARGDAVSVPKGDDGTKLHMWARLNAHETAYSRPDGTDHSGLDVLMKTMGGKHKDVIVGTKTSKREYGLEIANEGWLKTHPNGDGANTSPYADSYKKLDQQKITYIGELKATITQAMVETQCELSP